MPPNIRAFGALVTTMAAAVLMIALTSTAMAAAPTPSGSPTGPVATPTWSGSPTGSQQPCADPGPPPSGVTAYANLVNTAGPEVQAVITWTPLVEPAHCGPGVTEIEQVSPPGPTITAPSADGRVVIRNLTTLTPYTWRLRFIAGTVSQWGTVSVPPVLPLDYCLGLPAPRRVTASTPSPTSLHLEWGQFSYPALCGGSISVQALGASTPAATVDLSHTGVTLTGLTPGSMTTWVVSFKSGLGSLLVELDRVTVIQRGPGPDGGATCSATARFDSVWGEGFVATVTVTNTGTTAIGRWTVAGTLPYGVQLTNAWNASATLAGGTLTATNATWNGALAPGASTTFGMQAARSGGGTVAVPSLTCTASQAT